jgi:regulator of cell morphogenesis and NO signaling
MTSLAPETSVGQMVRERPGLASLFDRLGIDYCCGGRTSLAQACAEKGLDVDEVLLALPSSDLEDASADRPEEDEMTLGELADQIVAIHHTYLHQELPRLAGLLAKVADAHAANHPELRVLRDVFADLKDELEFHMLKEEKILFPLIKQLETAARMPGFPCDSLNNPILVMEHEHASAGSALERMRALTGGYNPPRDACPTYLALLQGLAELETDLHHHIHKENNILFPQARALEDALKGAS